MVDGKVEYIMVKGIGFGVKSFGFGFYIIFISWGIFGMFFNIFVLVFLIVE